ncbi:hypothetical protein ABK040_008748 [Willaertia magna]
MNCFTFLKTIFWFFALNFLIFYFLYTFYFFPDRLKHQDLKFEKNLDPKYFDYIIIGSGSSGSILANRLSSKNNNLTVLLLEAGRSDNNPFIQYTPGYLFLLKSIYDWQYYTTEQPIIQPNNKLKRLYWPRGKVLGGCSSLNAMIYLRGNPNDYNEWNDCEFGNKSKIWNFENVLKYFKKTEKQLGNKSIYNEKYHGFNGELIVNDGKDIFSITRPIINAISKTFGIPIVNDLNNPTLTLRENKNTTTTNSKQQLVDFGAVGFTQIHVYNGKRFSVVDAFLNETVLQRKNLFVRTQAHVTKILMKGKRAIGVKYYDERKKRYIIKKCRKEVILSAGAINSPQLLMLSGIGDKSLLESINLKVKRNLPRVGRHLKDHIAIHIPFYVSHQYDSAYSLMFEINEIFKVLFKKEGKLTSNGIELNTLIKTKVCDNNNILSGLDKVNSYVNRTCYHKYQCQGHDIQIHGMPTIVEGSENFKLFTHGFSLVPILLKPKSEGLIQLNSNNPFDPPIIDSNFLSEKIDKEIISEAIRLCLEVGKYLKEKKVFIGEAPHVKELIMKLNQSNISEEDKRNYLLQYALNNLDVIYHPVGTCRMSNSIKRGVVNEEFKVHNVDNLRVVDASVLPSIPRANPQATLVMIGEVASELILKDDKKTNDKKP